MKNIVLLSLVLIFSLLPIASPAGPAFLTPAEQEWLNAHQTITVGADPDSPPFEFFDSQDTYRGLSADYLDYLGQTLGVEFTIVKGSNWAELMELARQKKIDLLPAIVPSQSRREFLDFTTPWITVPGVVISGTPCRSIEDLQGRTVAVVDGSIWDDYLTRHTVDISIVRVDDVRTALELTAMNGVSAMVTNLATASALIHELGIGNLRVVLRLDKKTDIAFGVRRDWPELVSILNKSIAAMNPEMREEIRHRWIRFADLPWWQNSSVRRIGLMVAAGFCSVLLFFIVWNRILKREVRKRSKDLEKAHRHLIRAAKMESIGQLAAGVAHEVKNPLAIISMGVELLEDNPDLDATERRILSDMDDAVERADRVVRSLLDYSRYSRLNPRPGDLNEVITRALELVEHEMKKNHVTVHTDLGELKTVVFDFNRIQQVFINLFLNSAQVMEDGGDLYVVSRMHRLTPDEARRSDHFETGMEVVKVTVSDTGPGIAGKDSEKLFDPFYTTKDIGEGTGLGLSESRNITELHNGTLHLGNREQGGARAVLLLPLEPGEKNEKKDTAR